MKKSIEIASMIIVSIIVGAVGLYIMLNLERFATTF